MAVPASETDPGSAADQAAPRGTETSPVRRRVGDWTPLLLLRAAHPRQALITAVCLAVAAALSGRPTREVGLVFLTVLIGQSILGWHNDLVDRERDRRHGLPGKPVADGRLDPGTVWFAMACAGFAVVPLAIANGVTAGSVYLGVLAVGLMANVVLRKGLLSWVPWAVTFGLYVAFLSYGGWGGGAAEGSAPEPAMVALTALLGVGVHVLRALWGLVPDNQDGWTYLPLRLGLRLGASRLLTVASVYVVVVLVAMALVAGSVGLSR